MSIIINPGSGDVPDATEDAALDCIEHFVTDLKLSGVRWLREPREDKRGRFGFVLYDYRHPARITVIQMPGLPLDKVRFMDGDAWPFPRLYVNGSSWLWKFAINCALADLTEPEAGYKD